MISEYEFINKEYYYNNILINVQREVYKIIDKKFDFDGCKPIVEVNIRFINTIDDWELMLVMIHNNEKVSKVIYSTLENIECDLEKEIEDLYNDTLF